MLVVGNEYAVSWGVRTHAGLSISDVLTALEDRDLGSYDAVMVLTGVGDAFQLVPPLQGRRSLQELNRSLTASTAPVTIVGVQPVSSVNICHAKEHGVTDRWEEALNEMTESVCLGEPRVRFLAAPSLPANALAEVDKIRFKSPTVYKAWAVDLARHLVPPLTVPLSDSLSEESVTGPLDVRRRVKAIQDLRILHSAPEARFTSLVRRARDLFTTEGAVFSLVTDTHQWNKAMVGFSRTELPIEESFCAITIKTAGPFVVEDSWADPRITFSSAIRFYAGCPVYAPDGSPVGALCVFDANPRSASTIVTSFLEELARHITGQLALPPDRPLAPAA